jgi:hypothetical protein
MTLANQLRSTRWALSVVLSFPCCLALGGCGGTTYNLGDTGDGGAGGGGGGGGGSRGGCLCVGPPDAGNCACADGGGNAGIGNGSSGFGASAGGSGGGNGSSNAQPSGGGSNSGGFGASACTAGAPGCSGGATGYSCSGGPPQESGLSCDNGTRGSSTTVYCCIPWPSGSACTPYPNFPCGGIGSYGYQCAPGTSPSDVNARLSCGTNFALANGDNAYCCTYP